MVFYCGDKALLFNASIDDLNEAVIKTLQAKGYKVLQSLENKIMAKHGLSASYYLFSFLIPKIFVKVRCLEKAKIKPQFPKCFQKT